MKKDERDSGGMKNSKRKSNEIENDEIENNEMENSEIESKKMGSDAMENSEMRGNEIGSNETENSETGRFFGAVLLDSPVFDSDQLKSDLLEDWGIEVPDDEEDGTLVFEIDGRMAVISLMPAPVPNGEAELYAESNYFWKGAVDAAKEHQAHLFVSVLPGEDCNPIAVGKLFVKLASSCLKQENATGIYTAGTVFEPDMYCAVAEDMKEGEDTYPILDWIYFGLYETEEGLNGYTYGLKAFGKEEIEVVNSIAPPSELHEFLYNVVSYVLCDDALLKDGETIGFTEDEYLPITRSASAALSGETLKIAFMPKEG